MAPKKIEYSAQDYFYGIFLIAPCHCMLLLYTTAKSNIILKTRFGNRVSGPPRLKLQSGWRVSEIVIWVLLS